MKVIVQRVQSAKVMAGEEFVSSIGRGICVLVGLTHGDNEKDADYIARKLLALRIFDDQTGKRWQRSVKDEHLEVLCVSQFTLYHQLKGNKPDFHRAMQGDLANTLYSYLIKRLSSEYLPEKIKDGKFGAYMQLHIQNDGPVTLELESFAGKTKNEDSTDTKC